VSFCKYCDGCSKQIWIMEINGKCKPYDDAHGTSIHNCTNDIKIKNFSNKEDVSDNIRTIYHILDNHSKELEELRQKLDTRK